jgi:hypothetical protein
VNKKEAGRLGGLNPEGPLKRRGEGNGKWMGDVKCTACAEPAVYKTKRLCKRCYTRVDNIGFAVGPVFPGRANWKSAVKEIRRANRSL